MLPEGRILLRVLGTAGIIAFRGRSLPGSKVRSSAEAVTSLGAFWLRGFLEARWLVEADRCFIPRLEPGEGRAEEAGMLRRPEETRARSRKLLDPRTGVLVLRSRLLAEPLKF